MNAATPPAITRRPKTPGIRKARDPLSVQRTTVTLNADASEILENFKAATGLSTSRAIEELILRSVPRKPRIKMVNGRAVFDLPIEKGSISTEQLLRLEDETW